MSSETCCSSALATVCGGTPAKAAQGITYKEPGFCYRARTSWRALRALSTLPKEKVETFLKSYEIFELEKIRGEADASKIVNYYEVLNHLCACGEVEKMYIPAVIDLKYGVFKNQVLFEEQLAKDIGAKPGAKILDTGCGRGRIAHHMATHTGAHVSGFNIDPNQIQAAQEYAVACGLLGKQLDFKVHNFNHHPLPYADASFDAVYNVQAYTYVQDYVAFFKEINRILKPGGKFSFLDWAKKDAYDENNPQHKEIMAKVKPLIGAVRTPHPNEWCEALQAAGFKVIFSKDASVNGHQYPLIEDAKNFFEPLQGFVQRVCKWRILPDHLNVLFDRFTRDGQAFIDGDKLDLFTSSWQILAEKPARA